MTIEIDSFCFIIFIVGFSLNILSNLKLNCKLIIYNTKNCLNFIVNINDINLM